MALYDTHGPDLIQPYDLFEITKEQQTHQIELVVSGLVKTILDRILDTKTLLSSPTPPSFVMPLLSDVGEALWTHYGASKYGDHKKEYDTVYICDQLESRLDQDIHTLLPTYKVCIQSLYYQNVYTLHCNWGISSRMQEITELVQSSIASHSPSSSSSIFTYFPLSLFPGCVVS